MPNVTVTFSTKEQKREVVQYMRDRGLTHDWQGISVYTLNSRVTTRAGRIHFEGTDSEGVHIDELVKRYKQAQRRTT